MQIGSVGSLPSYASPSRTSQPEAIERGPDRDHDGDEGSRATAPASRSAPAAGRGASVDTVA
jgi:hypothetical protein